MGSTETTPSRWQVPRIDHNERWVGGVAAAIAVEIGVQPLVIRIAFAALTFVVGWGLLLYVFIWIVMGLFSTNQISPYRPQPKGATSVHRHLAIVLVVVGLMIGLVQITPEAFTSVSWPIGFVFAGGLIAWSRGGDEKGSWTLVRIVAGLAVAIGGALAFAALSYSALQALVALVFGLAIVMGIVLIAAPSVVQLARSLDDERLDRIRVDERERLSAHLHDSVLQTLSLIQKNADDPAHTAQLARRQERELRNWLYGPSLVEPGGVYLGAALEAAATEVEQRHGVPIEVVSVGDTGQSIGGDIEGLVAAAREAMTNAAIHSGAERVDVFAERRTDAVEIFVRDTGRGFDPARIIADRRGVSESIIGRMSRAGGHGTIHSTPGEGTEVELVLPLTQQIAIEETTTEIQT